MNTADHYADLAEQALAQARRCEEWHLPRVLAEAQVYATLAQAAATTALAPPRIDVEVTPPIAWGLRPVSLEQVDGLVWAREAEVSAAEAGAVAVEPDADDLEVSGGAAVDREVFYGAMRM